MEQTHVILLMDEELKKQLKAKAKENGLTLSGYIRMVLKKELNDKE